MNPIPLQSVCSVDVKITFIVTFHNNILIGQLRIYGHQGYVVCHKATVLFSLPLVHCVSNIRSGVDVDQSYL